MTSTSIILSIDCLPDGGVGIGVLTSGGDLSPTGVLVLDSLLDVLQEYFDVNDISLNVRRPRQ